MTAPILTKKKFWIIKPSAGRNYVKNPQPYISTGGYSVSGGTIAIDSTNARRGPGCIKCTPNSGVPAIVSYSGLTGTSGLAYSFSLDVLGVAGQAMRIYVQISGTSQGTKTFTATGYWQRISLSFIANTTGAVVLSLQRDSIASTAPFWTDGWQFEQAVKPSTFISGDLGEGYYWEGLPRDSASTRMNYVKTGGELLDLEDYCQLVQVTGLGHGDWNQILTKMTSGGDLYQGHIRKSRQFSIIVDFIGDTLGEIEANRKALIDAIRPDLFEGEMVVRYQGFDDNGNEATNPIDIRCIPLPATLTDTPDLPSHQRAVLNFEIPSGLLQGAYNEGKELELFAEFPANYIVKRDPQGNWCEFNTGTGDYTSLITGLNGRVDCIAEAPDGKIYVGGDFTNAGGITGANYLARWNPITELWEAVVAGINNLIYCMVFDANGDLYIGGAFTDLGSANGDRIVKISALNTANPVITALGTGLDNECRAIAIAPDGNLYAGGLFGLAGGVANTSHIAVWTFDSGYTWAPLGTGLNDNVLALAIAPNGDLYVGGSFDNVAYPYLCKWNGAAFSAVGTNTDINGFVYSLAFGATGYLYVGGDFTNAGGDANADRIARWNGASWESLGSGTNNTVCGIVVFSGKVYASGYFTTAGGLTLTDRVAVWSNGAWQPLDVDLPGTSTVYAVLPASDGSLYIGGDFSTVAETPDQNAKTGIVALNLNVASASANTYPVVSVTGPGTLKSITNYRTGKAVMFDGLTLQPGEWISLNFDPLNLSFRSGWAGRGNLMRYIIPGSDYGDFYVSPGDNYLSLFMDNTTSATKASIVWTPKFWGLDGALLQ